ncbi:hypothetical protein [Nocardiopsis chromatogenes]|uniref:hypothetical protein n=1 Tax=Nocardiopsis chromatogenes TaxID=280239 RepID=UPI00034B153A|nr:hypothetical protein [Nocardiopsis chromatogenes]
MWFVGTGRAGAAHADGVAARLRKAESDERSCQDVLGDYDRAHRELEERVERLEAELAEARRQKLEAFARWWNCREDRDRARHVARRLRRRLKRIHRREIARGGSVPAAAAEAEAQNGQAVDIPAQAGGPDRTGHPDHAGYPDGTDRSARSAGPDRSKGTERAAWAGQPLRWAYMGPGRGLPLDPARASEDIGDGRPVGRHRTDGDNVNGDNGGRPHLHPADGHRAGGSGPIPSQREGGEDAEETGGSGGVGGDRERQRPRVGWKRANGNRRRPRD